MILNDNFVLREIAGESILVPVGEQAVSISGVVALNSVAATIWSVLKEKPDYDAVLSAVLDQYDVSEETARSDIDALLAQMEEIGLLKME